MRILSLIHRYHPAIGGAESHMASINARLVKRGHDVTVLTSDAKDFSLFWDPSAERFLDHEDSHQGVQLFRFPVLHLPSSKWAFPITRLMTGAVAKLIPNTQLVGRLTKLTPRIPAMEAWLAESNRPFDVVMGMTLTLEGIMQIGLEFAKSEDIPFVIFPLTHFGGGSTPGADPTSRFYTLPHQKNIVRQADGVVALNPAEGDFYAGQKPPKQKIIVAPSALDQNKLSGGDGNRWREAHQVGQVPIVATISALTRNKGTLQTLAAMQRLWGKGHRVKLVLAGMVHI